MKEVLLSADNSAKLCRVPDRVAERLEEVAWLFAGEWLWQSPDAGRFHQMRDGIDTVVYDERDFLWWLGAVYAPEELRGGDPEQNAEILQSVLTGVNRGAPRAAVLLNAGAAIYVAGVASTLEEGIALAGRSIDSGAAERKLELLIEASHGTGA